MTKKTFECALECVQNAPIANANSIANAAKQAIEKQHVNIMLVFAKNNTCYEQAFYSGITFCRVQIKKTQIAVQSSFTHVVPSERNKQLGTWLLSKKIKLLQHMAQQLSKKLRIVINVNAENIHGCQLCDAAKLPFNKTLIRSNQLIYNQYALME
jgi:EAL domain-containing protein (putative c-di-GMP-specific phosphodiesterase class I)